MGYQVLSRADKVIDSHLHGIVDLLDLAQSGLVGILEPKPVIDGDNPVSPVQQHPEPPPIEFPVPGAALESTAENKDYCRLGLHVKGVFAGAMGKVVVQEEFLPVLFRELVSGIRSRRIRNGLGK